MAYDVEKLMGIASAEVGYLEKASNSQLDSKTANAGNANYTKYGRDLVKWIGSPYGINYQWCDQFVDWCMIKAFGINGAKQLLGGWSAYTPTSSQYFKNMGQWYTSNPKRGDQIFFKNNIRICHTGIVERVSNGVVYTIEGNTSSGNNTVISNGGCVARKSYALNNSRIAGYGRPRYGYTSAISSSTIKAWQTQLKNFGFYTDKLDGDWGANSKSATKKFQEAFGLAITGEVDYNTNKKLMEVSELTSLEVFDADYYVSSYKDLKGMTHSQALVHWINYGINEGRKSSRVFDVTFYKKQYPKEEAFQKLSNKQLVQHFLHSGMKEGRQAHEDFIVQVYKKNYADLRKEFGNDLKKYYSHYVKYGYNEKRNGKTKL